MVNPWTDAPHTLGRTWAEKDWAPAANYQGLNLSTRSNILGAPHLARFSRDVGYHGTQLPRLSTKSPLNPKHDPI
jgi:hypothetical protein